MRRNEFKSSWMAAGILTCAFAVIAASPIGAPAKKPIPGDPILTRVHPPKRIVSGAAGRPAGTSAPGGSAASPER
jgi:hypothetical protein